MQFTTLRFASPKSPAIMGVEQKSREAISVDANRCSLILKRLCALASCAVPVLAGVSAIPAGTIRHDRSDALYTELADDTAYQSVGSISWRQGGGAFAASGVLISNDWVLTAAHVVEGNNFQGGGITNLTFRVEGSTYSAQEWFTHPNWQSSNGDLDAGADIGLIQLQSTVRGVEPATLYEGRNERGKIGTIVGFGDTGTGLTGATESNDIKRAGKNVIDVVGRSYFGNDRLMATDFDNPNTGRDSSLGSRFPIDLEYSAARGDSGGGLFIEVGNEDQLAGIISYISALDFDIDSDYGDQSGFTRVSSLVGWIESVAGPLEVLFGDLNGDDLLTAADIDLLTDEIGFNTTDDFYDLNDDGSVDMVDRTYWVEEIFQTYLGDANLDGSVDELDFENLHANMFFFNTGWTDGDFNGDGNTDVADFNLWNDNRGLVGSPPAFASVPEPHGIWLAFYGLAAVLRRRSSVFSLQSSVSHYPHRAAPRPCHVVAAGRRTKREATPAR